MMSLAQDMLKESFPSLRGLQPTILSRNNSFHPVQSAAGSIQIHYNGKFHWFTSTCVDISINLYESVYSGISASLQVQLAQVYNTKIKDDQSDKLLFLEVPAVQQQNGGSNSRLFAIGFAYHAGLILDDMMCFTIYSYSYNVMTL